MEVAEYPKMLYSRDGGHVIVQDAAEEDARKAHGWGNHPRGPFGYAKALPDPLPAEAAPPRRGPGRPPGHGRG
jgi:hypothetical protein